MKAVILTAGEGLRIRPLTNNMTKGMIPIANRPILEHIVHALSSAGIKDIIMVVGYKKEKILSYFSDGGEYDVNLTFVEQERQLGTAHALGKVKHLLTGEFVVLPGDNYIESLTLKELFSPGREPYRVVVTSSHTPSKYGVVTLQNNFIRKIEVTPRSSEDPRHFGIQHTLTHSMWQKDIRRSSDLIFTCICRLDPRIFDYLEEMQGIEKNNMTGLIGYMIDKGIDIEAVKTDVWFDAVYPWDLLFMNSQALTGLKSSNEGVVEEGAFLMGDVSVGKGTVIRSNCYVQGPVLIGEGCDIGPNACIYPSTSIGDNVTVDAFTKISNSIIMDDAAVAPGGIIENSVLACGTKCSPNVSTQITDIDMGINKNMGFPNSIGCIVGEDTVLGHGAVIDGGVVVGSGCAIDAFVQVRDDVPDGSRVVR